MNKTLGCFNLHQNTLFKGTWFFYWPTKGGAVALLAANGEAGSHYLFCLYALQLHDRVTTSAVASGAAELHLINLLTDTLSRQ